ncbi:YhfX family PLP-dependent enzyme [Vibrio diazotrophicus]|jgi:predicted amino acid racemase|uniref:YhfX family PLP-dependent enzyme n=1 Tax=Vibrio diazotrophicus TaxID=685 RepID=UPI0005A86ABA|nr:YhfX family PLP-dependent enzyme [Vibrio diazotrophicus]
MFVNALQKHNPALIDAALLLHAEGKVLPDSYIVDLDTFVDNAKKIKAEADKYGIALYAMTKQFGRNPYLARLLVEDLGYQGIVCVDYKEARLFSRHGIKVANVGHLVQPPQAMLEQLMSDVQPDVVTVVTMEKAIALSQAAIKANRVQKVLLKFYDSEDVFYTNQETGFPLAALSSVVAEIEKLPGIRIAGLTHFPCLLADKEQVMPTPNAHTAAIAAQQCRDLGIEVEQLNLPSMTCCSSMSTLSQLGATHGEPGHALTGTTPLHQFEQPQPETIAMLYLSEVSHHHQGKSYCFGGGYYRRGHMENALIWPQVGFPAVKCQVHNENQASIDYHLRLSGIAPVGSPVVMAFRTQVFVTRSDVVIVSGIHHGQPRVIGVWDSLGNEVAHG